MAGTSTVASASLPFEKTRQVIHGGFTVKWRRYGGELRVRAGEPGSRTLSTKRRWSALNAPQQCQHNPSKSSADNGGGFKPHARCNTHRRSEPDTGSRGAAFDRFFFQMCVLPPDEAACLSLCLLTLENRQRKFIFWPPGVASVHTPRTQRTSPSGLRGHGVIGKVQPHAATHVAHVRFPPRKKSAAGRHAI